MNGTLLVVEAEDVARRVRKKAFVRTATPTLRRGAAVYRHVEMPTGLSCAAWGRWPPRPERA